MDEAIAHVRMDDTGRWHVHLLEEHLKATGKLAGEFAAQFGNQDWGYLIGLWHDLGKYRPAFQSYIKTVSGYNPSAHIEELRAVGRVDHSTAGAIHAVEAMGSIGRILAYCIAGHHAGLSDWEKLNQRLQKGELLKDCKSLVPCSVLNYPPPTSKPHFKANGPLDFSLWLRMLFSCLCDADFLDTESFMNLQQSGLRGQYTSLSKLKKRLDGYLEQKQKTCEATKVNQIRKQVLEDCNRTSSEPGNIFSLTVPTGGGKTLASMAFALSHAETFNKSKVIYVIPYTSIIEQTCEVFKEAFGPQNVLEHHSNLDPSKETPESRVACENWDAPVIVTTSVQFFESLFAVKTSRIRKLHNLANSIVVLDEVQLLPSDFLTPIIFALNSLLNGFGVTLVLCTATQPALTESDGHHFKGLPKCREIVADPKTLHEEMRRFNFNLPPSMNEPTSWAELAQQLNSYDSVLCIVDRRDDCRELHRLMPPGTFHLSGLMCGEHRSEIIKTIKHRLSIGSSTRVISTQLVEAGVDIDFPVVYRALAGLDSIAQAGGRCNREGRLQAGELNLFIPPSKPPIELRQAQQCAKELLIDDSVDKLAPGKFIQYFNHLYWCKGDKLDKHQIVEALTNRSGGEVRFREAAQKFVLIDEEKQASVLVRWGKSVGLIEALKRNGPNRDLLRKLQRYCISLPRYVIKRLVDSGDLEDASGYFIQGNNFLYDSNFGFILDGPNFIDPENLIA